MAYYYSIYYHIFPLSAAFLHNVTSPTRRPIQHGFNFEWLMLCPPNIGYVDDDDTVVKFRVCTLLQKPISAGNSEDAHAPWPCCWPVTLSSASDLLFCAFCTIDTISVFERNNCYGNGKATPCCEWLTGDNAQRWFSMYTIMVTDSNTIIVGLCGACLRPSRLNRHLNRKHCRSYIMFARERERVFLAPCYRPIAYCVL